VRACVHSITPASNEHTSTPIALCNADSVAFFRSTVRAFDVVRGWNVTSSCRINVTVTLLKSKRFSINKTKILYEVFIPNRI